MGEGFLLHVEVHVPPGAAPRRTVHLLHGILGAGRNWRSFARRLANQPPGTCVVLPDLRLHGASRGAPPPDTIEACADDLLRLDEALRLAPDAVVGHSFGGKVALAYAARRPPSLRRVVVLDSPLEPEPLERAHRTLPWRLLDFVEDEPGPFAARGDAVAAMEARGVPRDVARWFATNLERGPGGFRFPIDASRIRALLEDYFRFDAFALLDPPPEGLSVAVVRAGRSDRLSAEAVRRVRAVSARGRPVRFLEVPDAGHWLHVDAPDATLRTLLDALGAD